MSDIDYDYRPSKNEPNPFRGRKIRFNLWASGGILGLVIGACVGTVLVARNLGHDRTERRDARKPKPLGYDKE